MSIHTVWQHYNPVHVIQGEGLLQRISEWVPPGEVLLVTTQGFTQRGITQKVLELIPSPVIVYDQVIPNPDLDLLDKASDILRKNRPKSIIALGGGSVIDTGKVFSLSLASENTGFLKSILYDGSIEMPNTSLHLVSIPTTAGTGSEVTPFATIWDHKNKQKKSLSSEMLFSKVAILDPLLHLTLPRQETVYSALDCISHALETIWNKNRTPISETLAIKALTYSLSAFPRIIDHPHDITARQAMMTASTLAGFAISQNRTALAHSISYPLTLNFSVPHGLAVGFTLIAIIHFLRRNIFFKVNSTLDKQIQELEKMLYPLNLNSDIIRYVSFEQAVEKISEMFTPERLGNFVYTIGPDDIYSILKDSFKC